ncbi:hypothetical protein PC116_g5075 [Phytophthora cactorum]|uniref:IQ motif, EF-hand binding site n=2 Tax=Phytophthora cactorum TaxID=29920 RepID=A0A329SPH2_9STRA|nr:hypothetical protein Pcac1_g20803 [Phytophthora cactorum]KAG2843519.1 hypothetical protein PC112_g2585 [Phytophthora cactorum]KAG2845009.1 hypothetical protein PC111_g1735 [Phytophthora cactorum]KAG2866745.1 hypothetical protein PC113_g2553 [Phytophthora cactorum]KAG2941157.1 hypothetical protein PC115_g2148 [Phytophthora cactorum]
MVRKASRLAPGQQSVEEVLLNRLANGESATLTTRSSTALPSNCSTRRSQALTAPRGTAADRRLSGSNRAGVHMSTAPAGTGVKSSARAAAIGLTGAPPMSMEFMQQISSEIANLDQRLQRVATNLAAAPSRETEKRTATSSNDERNVHQLGIEKFLQSSIQEVANTHKTGGSEDNARRSTSVNPKASAQVTYSVRDIRSTVRRLDKVFHEVASGDKQRHLAATKISMMCRGFVVCRRYQKLQIALGNWRSRKCVLFLTYMEEFAAREEFVNKQIVIMQEERTRSFLRRVLAEIRDVVLMNLPVKMARLEETEHRFRERQSNLLKYVFLPWKSAALGPRSRKRATADARARHYAARQRLEAMERFDLITQEMVHEEFLKDNIRRIRTRHPMHVLKRYFHLMKGIIFVPMKKNMEVAIAHDHRKILKRVVDEWVKVFRATQIDKAIASAVERRTLERYDQHFNLRKIDAHYRRTHMLKHLRAWSKHCQLIRRVRRLFEGSTKETLNWLMKRWRVRAQYQRALRENTVEEWHAYSRRIYTIPFRRWYVFMARRRAARLAKESICVAYERRQRRHIKYNFFRLWKHQVLFGHIEGLHSKVHLLRSLEDQKRMCIGLEANAVLYRDNIAALQASIVQLEDKLMEKQQELAQLHETTQATRFGIHQAEQSIARVQGMLEAVRIVHPGTVERVETMYRDNPLLSKDLKDVISLHANKRRELLSKIELDRTELEVQNASKGAGTQEDQMLLHRVKWVLSRLDLGMHEQTGNNQHDTRMTGNRVETMNQLCALFEFIRNGDTVPLAPVNNPEHREQMQHSRSMDSMVRFNNSDDGIVRRADIMDDSNTWHSFLQSLVIKFVPDNLLSVKERLVRRAADMDAEVAEIKANPQLHHLYR